jgi:DNA-binding transcriptional LysR family regulator
MRVTLDDLPALALFARVVKLRSFTAAAAEAGLAKASVSQRITRLEDRLGVQLLRRSSRKLSLTSDGMRLYEHAALLTEVARGADSALAAGHQPRGRVKLNAPSTIHRAGLATALSTFLDRHPEVALHVTLDDRLIDLVDGDFDVLIRVVQPSQRTFVARRLGAERVVVVGAPSYIERAPPLLTPYDLIHHTCLRNAAIPERIDWRLGSRGRAYTVGIRSRFETADFALLHEAALAGVGLLVAFKTTVAGDIAEGRLATVLDQYTGDSLGIYLVVAERARPTAATRALVDHLVQAFRQWTKASRALEPS